MVIFDLSQYGSEHVDKCPQMAIYFNRENDDKLMFIFANSTYLSKNPYVSGIFHTVIECYVTCVCIYIYIYTYYM